ncbi:THAP domain-containing 6-like [Paramuricea clavata]|uniref:THAP domain-containing 6-like n=1 Tax=Paramuricea clavata TaxID=317549 RepID=A0A7D9HVG9_PARCT|nr:THAP domain-containing 6-like [Paramuricea clavata]
MGKHRGSQCCAFGCSKRRKFGEKSTDRSNSEGSSDEESFSKRKFARTFHYFPSNPERKKQWIKNIRRDGWLPNNSSVICSDHFKESNIDRTGLLNVRLKPDAVPTRFKKFPQHLKKVVKKRKLPTPRVESQKVQMVEENKVKDDMPTPDPQEFPVAAPDNEVDEGPPFKKPCLDSVPTKHASTGHASPEHAPPGRASPDHDTQENSKQKRKKNNITKEEIESVSAEISMPE